MWILLILITLLLSLLFKKQMFNTLTDMNKTELNYKGIEIPIGMGLMFIPPIIFFSGFLKYFFIYNISDLLIIAILMMAFVGFLDDMTKDKKNKGLKGHIKALVEFNITTGMLKAMSGFVIALYVSLEISNGAIEIIVNLFLISLFTNFMNLWDLRPGRASKIFLITSLILMPFMASQGIMYMILIITVLLVYIKGDLNASYMMGDCGSNLLGVYLGIICATSLSIWFKIGILIVLVLIHVIAEKISFSSIIENNKFLKYLDMLGR
ncbi:UDP-N-acetylmuramyl pentapeptide phosphotransferase/UDP-N-acetylglucosamine-1-phosphate transferase [Acetoanaerobium pronyense]|uniref:UDP-N-acetylmuramyl pentapeptide phosphotransferase/UDP-N-acetylglucosamine-1-phosphate transferase n=2 Tax=Acetoanaerobium pronyense TaxID=1482736 RepID=A0ABS4KJS9_9FIRM|nr:UDP-N-acetylmuramyl pentapeptide phosphotransferase/UDP-N-acetylglucosamine-1-phosphate transferase [Acetoanaerobium pronyense]